MFTAPDSSRIVAEALAEDLGVTAQALLNRTLGDVLARDVTSSSVIPEGATFAGRIVARQAAVLAGLPLVAATWELLCESAGRPDAVEVFPLVAEGSRVSVGTAVAEITGDARLVLTGERTALDFLMVLSGMATETSEWVALAGDRLDVFDTRKTIPGLRALSKYAVHVGGGHNHRSGLYDAILVKDNHLRHAASIGDAIAAARAAHPGLVLEVEADTLEQAVEIVGHGADVVLLDNMDAERLAEAVRACREAAETRGRAVVIEVSGGVERGRLGELRRAGVDRVSSSVLTLAAPPVDFALDEGGVTS